MTMKTSPTQEPLVSVLTPSFNQAHFLDDCLKSVRTQTYPNIEHIVVDGGSTDETMDILRDAPRVRWISEPDRGQSHALNKALSMSQGEIIGWVNSDDAYADRRAVAWAVEALGKSEAVAAFGHALLINETNEVLQVLASLPFWRPLVKIVHYPVQPTFFFRRDALADFVREDLRYVMDRDLMLRISASSRVVHLNRIVAVDRHQSGRKVLTPAFREEVLRYDDAIGNTRTLLSRGLSKATRILLRAGGIPLTINLASSLEPAIRLRLPDTVERLRRQCLVPRQRMPFELKKALR